jgi:hypothetical protein
MRNEAVASLLIVAIMVGAGAGYLVGHANERTAISISTSTTTFVSALVQTTTMTVNSATTIIWGTPIPITSVETGNVIIGGSPYTIAVNPNASRVYVAGGSNVLTVVDAVSHSVVARVTLPSASSSGVSIDYKTGTVFVLVQGGIAEINGTSNKVVGEIPINFGYGSIAFDSVTDTIYGSTGNGSLIGVDSHKGKVTANVSIGYWASDVLVNPQLNLIYAVGCSPRGLVCDSTISVVNGTNAKLMKETTLGSAYYATATIDKKTGIVYVSGEAQLVALNPYGTVIHNYYPDTCGPFIGMAGDPALNQVIMAPQNYNYLLVYNGWFGNLLNMYSLPDSPQYVAFNPVTKETYVIVSESLLTLRGMAGTGHVNDTLIGAGQFCLPV